MWLLDVSDLAPFASISDDRAVGMIEDATFMAALVAPCLAPDKVSGLSEIQQGAARAILRGAIIRWNESGSGALTQQSAGPFAQSIDTRQNRKAMFWPTEIEQLQKICSGSKGGAFQIDTAPAVVSVALDWCEPSFDEYPTSGV